MGLALLQEMADGDGGRFDEIPLPLDRRLTHPRGFGVEKEKARRGKGKWKWKEREGWRDGLRRLR